jgi:hypothetical protein
VYDVGGACQNSGGGGSFNCLVTYINGNPQTYGPFNAETAWGTSSDWHIEYAAESAWTGADIAGTAAAPATVSNMDYLGCCGIWRQVPCGLTAPVNDDSAHWAGPMPDCQTENLYTSHAY